MTTGALSIEAFCKAHSISRATFYNLRKRGKAPKTLVVGRRRLVADEASAAWRRSMEESINDSSTENGRQP
jgi:predicted DNA-binding transcriptional regulator AlpA